MTLPVYTLDKLPAGCHYYPANRTLIVNCPVPHDGNVIFLPTYYIEPKNENKIFGKWKISEDGLDASSNEITKKVALLLEDYVFTVAIMLNISKKQQIKKQLQNNKRFMCINVYLPHAFLISVTLINIALAIALIMYFRFI